MEFSAEAKVDALEDVQAPRTKIRSLRRDFRQRVREFGRQAEAFRIEIGWLTKGPALILLLFRSALTGILDVAPA